jgi:hypothetical protein
MDTERVDSILWRFVVWTDFSQIHGGYASESGAGGKHISLPASKHEKVADFFGVPYHQDREDPVKHEIELQPVEGISGSEGPIVLRCIPSRDRGGEWLIADQHKNRYVLWQQEYGFPHIDEFEDSDDYYNSNPPIVYFVKDTDGDYHARAVYESTMDNLEKFPDQIRREWSQASKYNNFGIIDFDQTRL